MGNETTAARAAAYETTAPLLDALYAEVQSLARKKPDATINPTKVKLINRLLVDVKEVLSDEAAIKYLDEIDDDQLPLYSDVALILSQFSAAMGAFRAKYYYVDPLGNKGWLVRKSR
jgi:hypothetical protein